MKGQGFCECGCGGRTNLAKGTNRRIGHVKGQPVRFIVGHSCRGRVSNSGLHKGSQGRWTITCRDGSLVYFYRAVMEAAIGRSLGTDEHIHHVNGDCTDDRLENLELISPSDHARLHFRRDDACERGHPRTEENTYERSDGRRDCRDCCREREGALTGQERDEHQERKRAETLSLRAEGLTYTEIAKRLGVSETTVFRRCTPGADEDNRRRAREWQTNRREKEMV